MQNTSYTDTVPAFRSLFSAREVAYVQSLQNPGICLHRDSSEHCMRVDLGGIQVNVVKGCRSSLIWVLLGSFREGGSNRQNSR